MIGIYIDNLRLPWASEIFRIGEKNPITLFVNNISEMDVYSKVPVLASHHIWSFSDPIIAGDTFSATYLSQCPVPKKRAFYINHVDWNTNAFSAVDITKAANLLIACSPELESIVSRVWKQPTIIRNWNYEEICRLFETRTD